VSRVRWFPGDGFHGDVRVTDGELIELLSRWIDLVNEIEERIYEIYADESGESHSADLDESLRLLKSELRSVWLEVLAREARSA